MMKFDKGINRVTIVSNPVTKKVHFFNQRMCQCQGDDCILCDSHKMSKKIRMINPDDSFHVPIGYSSINRVFFRAIKDKEPETVIIGLTTLSNAMANSLSVHNAFYVRPFDFDFQLYYENESFRGKSFMNLTGIKTTKRREFNLDNFIFNIPHFSITDEILEKHTSIKVEYCKRLLTGEIHD